MNTVGIFAGRGDVIVAMVLAGFIGIWVGWQARRIKEWVAAKRQKT